MRSLTFVSLLLANCFVGYSSADETSEKQTAKSVMQKLSGEWEIDEGINRGRELTSTELEGAKINIEKDVIVTLDKAENERYRATFTIDVSKNPIQIDMTTKMEGIPPTKSLGIIRFEEDDDEQEWELCYALPGQPRPTKFESLEGSQHMLFELERED